MTKRGPGKVQVQSTGRIKTHQGHPIKYHNLSHVKDAIEYMREEDSRHSYGFRKVEGGYGIYKSKKK